MKTKLLALFALAFAGFAYAEGPKVIIISPSDLVEAWEGYAADRTTGEYSVVNANEIYSTYDYTTGEAGRPRNPAESIHAFIREKAAEDVSHFMLGGAWFDAQNPEKKVYFQGTDIALGLNNAIPGVYQYAYNDSASPSDLFYACLDEVSSVHWDADGDGKYLNDVVYTDGVANYDLTPDVVVSRVSLKSATGMDLWGIKINEGSTDLAAMIAAFSAKVTAGEAADFAGRDKYALIAGAVNDNLYQRERQELLPLFEREYEYYDGLPNFGDPAHGNTGNATTELLVRRRLRDQIAAVRPVAGTDILSSGGWARRYGSFGEAVEGYRAGSHEFDMMYSHGLISGGEVWGLSVGGQFLHPGHFGTMTGLNLFADYAGPCFGGVPDNSFTRNGRTYADFSCVEAMIANPTGGAVAAVGNARSGIYEGNYTVDFDNDFSWKLANRMLVNFIQENTTAGDAWKNTITSYVDDKTILNGTHVLIIAQEMLYGDPLVKLPAATPDPALVGIETSETAFTISEGRGHGGEGVVFTGAKGKLTLEGNEPYYLGGLKNATLSVKGNNKTIDLDACDFGQNAGGLSLESNIETATLRSMKRGSLASLNNNLYLRAGVSVELDTWDAFGDTKGTIQVGGFGAELIIGPNLCYPEREGRGESLNAGINFVGAKDLSLTIRVVKGGLFTPASALEPCKTTKTMSKSYTYTADYIIDSYDGLGGTVTVPANAKLTLNELPLSRIDTLTVAKGATLNLPEGAVLDELLSAGLATISKEANVYVGSTKLTLTEDQTIDGSKYKPTYYFVQSKGASAHIDWTSATKVAIRPEGEATEAITSDMTVTIANTPDGLTYINNGVACSKVAFINGASFEVGYFNNTWTLPSNWTFDIGEGSVLTIARWDGGTNKGYVKIGDNVTLNGAGKVTFGEAAIDAHSFGISGTATLDIPVTTTLTVEEGSIENPLIGSGSVVVKDVTKTFVIAPGWEGTFIVNDTSVGKPYVPKYEQLGDGLVKVSFVEREPKTYVINSAETWSALPTDYYTGDKIEIAEGGELTLTFAMRQPVIGSGRVVTTVSPSDVLKNSLKADSWTGTFVLKGLTANQSGDDLWNFDPSNYGNDGSQVELWNCKGFTAKNAVIERPIIITGEFCFSNGYSGRKNTLSCLKGTGTIKSTFTTMTYTVLDASEFYGAVENENVVILPASSPSVLKKNGYLIYTIGADGTVSEVAVTEKARPTIGEFALGETAAVTIAEPIAGLTYSLESTTTLAATAWDVEASETAETSAALTLEAAPSASPARFYRVKVTFE